MKFGFLDARFIGVGENHPKHSKYRLVSESQTGRIRCPICKSRGDIQVQRDSFGILRFFNLNLQLQSSTNVDDSFEGKIEFSLGS